VTILDLSSAVPEYRDHAVEEKAWAAGFFDGEGSIHVTRDKRPGRRVLLQINIEQVDPRPLRRWMEAMSLPCNISLRPSRSQNRQSIHRVCLGHDKSIKVIQKMWPYLSEPKQEQILRCVKEVHDAAAEVA
jgi:hypothetical protein